MKLFSCVMVCSTTFIITMETFYLTELSQDTAHYNNLSIMAINHVWKNCFSQGDCSNEI